MALGADAGAVARIVIAESTVLIAAGVLIGAVVAALATRLKEAL
jgi:ABC-type lipoprotein release transport system permease subunit